MFFIILFAQEEEILDPRRDWNSSVKNKMIVTHQSKSN